MIRPTSEPSTSSHIPSNGAPDRSAWRNPAVLAALAAVFLGALDLTVIATVLPRMIFDLEINTADVDRYVWIVNAYLLAYVIAIPVVGRISDIVGRRPVFLASLALFAAGSLACATADSLTELIVARTVQGIGGGALLPVAMALVGDLLPPGRRIATLGFVGAVDTFGWVLGPIWGAAVVGVLDSRNEAWRWIFYVNLPIAVVIAVAIGRAVRRTPPAFRAPTSPARLDVPGALLLAASTLLLNLGLSSGGELGTTGSGMRALGGTPNPLASYLVPLLIASGIAMLLLVWWERRASSPIVPLGLLRNRRFAAAIVANFLIGACLIVAMVDVPIVIALLVDQDRISTLSALVLTPFTALMAIASVTGGFVAGRRSEFAAAAAGLILVVVGYAALWVGLRDENYLGMIPGLVVAGAGFGLVIAPIGATALDAAAESDLGIAAGMTLVSRLLGMTVGISTLTAVGVRRLEHLTSRLDPIVRADGETTAQFLVRQTEFIQNEVIPLSVQVVRETYLLAAALAVLALIPIFRLRAQPPDHTESDVPALASPTRSTPRGGSP